MAEPVAAPSRYVRVLHGSLGHPKFIGLTAQERGTWLVCLQLADIAHPEPVHEAAVRMHVPDAAFERLYERGLLELTSPGWFRIHDLRQFHVSPSRTPEAAAARKRRSRARQRHDGHDGHESHEGPASHESHHRPDETRLDKTNNGSKGSQSESRATVDEPMSTRRRPSRPFEVPA